MNQKHRKHQESETASIATSSSECNVTSASGLDHRRLNTIVHLIQTEMSKPHIRCLNNRAVQAKIFQIPEVSSYMTELRRRETVIREDIMQKISQLIYRFQEHSLDATLARAGILKDQRVHAGSSLTAPTTCSTKDESEKHFDLLCLDAKERMYLILKSYDWLKEFFQYHPLHFYENSFQFVNRIPPKNIPVKVKVIGLGIGGSLAVSGLKKNGIEHVIGCDKRSRHGPRSVTSRFQNASWRAYDIAEGLLDEKAFDHLVQYQQRVHVKMEDTQEEKVMTADRVQIILGDAIDCALASAERYGADLRFDRDASTCDFTDAADSDERKDEGDDIDGDADIVALFAGARTSDMIPGLKEEMKMFSWTELSSKCRLWLEIKLSEKKEMYTARNVEVGAEKWHFTIESARNTKEDIVRIRDNLIANHNWNVSLLNKNSASETETIQELDKFNAQMSKIVRLLGSVEEKKEEEEQEQRFDYIFTNAPDNEHNQAKLESARQNGNVVIEGAYQVDIKIASKSVIDASSHTCEKTPDVGNSNKLLKQMSAGVIVVGGDACVPPNPMAAYGATLACEFAAMLVQLSVAHGHINAILSSLNEAEDVDPEWLEFLGDLKALFNQYYDARGLSENYFQWMQTLICNLYSLPPTL